VRIRSYPFVGAAAYPTWESSFPMTCKSGEERWDSGASEIRVYMVPRQLRMRSPQRARPTVALNERRLRASFYCLELYRTYQCAVPGRRWQVCMHECRGRQHARDV
jgi:hypothetical protein